MDTDDPHLHDGPAPGRRRRALVTASVAAAVLLAGGGAYWAQAALGGGSADGRPGGDATPPPLVLEGYSSTAESSGAASAPGGDPYRLAKGVELPDGPGSAAVHRDGGRVDVARVARLAKALGINAEPDLRQGTWLAVEGRDGAGPALRAAREAPGRWSFVRYQAPASTDCTPPPGPQSGTAEPPRCPALVPGGGPDDAVSSDGAPGAHDDPGTPQGGPASSAADGTSSSTGGPEHASPVPEQPGPDGPGAEPPVSERAAERAADPVLDALGLDGADVDASSVSGALRTVRATPQVAGFPTEGRQTQVTVGADGEVVRAQGLMAPLRQGPRYPVLDAARTLAELNNRGGGGETDMQCVQAPCEPADAGKPKPVTGAEFVLAQYAEHGEQVLVPSWRFTLGGEPEGLSVTHPALAARYLAPPATAAEPSTGPAEPHSPGSGDSPAAPPAESAVPPSDPGALPAPGQRVEAYQAKDRTLTLHFWGGVCNPYSARAEESADAVRVVVTAGKQKPGQVCIQIAKWTSVEVSLDAPVGGRAVLDADGRKIPRQ
ncbi:hypothetical protein QNO07_19235 [Streptomyces sp. 549]|uniref:hypothetical protein n=1 Tax=Streptomyces sp. 549 TaxID=3049076 RepID=UPI0024C3F722|nr:hypothetical protein [Streptomyces sp. 549]MDK1475524.1 hypothetical protein [Streptomyces sp. 549]